MFGIGGALRVRDSRAREYRYQDKRIFNGIFAPVSAIKKLCILMRVHYGCNFATAFFYAYPQGLKVFESFTYRYYCH